MGNWESHILTIRNALRHNKEYEIGDIVRNAMSDSQLKTMGRKRTKLHPVNSKRMVVVQDIGFGRYELQEFGAQTAEVIPSSTDLMQAVKTTNHEEREKAKLQALQTREQNAEYEIEAVTGERGVISHGTKEYRVKWKDYSKESWEPLSSFDKKSKPLQVYKADKRAQARSVAAVTTLTANLLALPSQDLIPEICRQAGVKEEDILFVYAGVPCETYSIAGRTNKDRDLHKTHHGYNYRDSDIERSPCCPPEAGCQYAEKARLHDSIVQQVISALEAGYSRGHQYHYGIENPDGELKYRPFMQAENWPQNLPMEYRPFDCCSFQHPAKKPMSFWTSMKDYAPTGTTGNGRCNNGECKQGEVNTETNMFNHLIKIARNPSDGFTGQGAAKMKNAMPQMWTEEFLQHAMKQSSKKIVIDLCSGWQSMRPVCEKLGLDYIAVDIEGDRNVRAMIEKSIKS